MASAAADCGVVKNSAAAVGRAGQGALSRVQGHWSLQVPARAAPPALPPRPAGLLEPPRRGRAAAAARGVSPCFLPRLPPSPPLSPPSSSPPSPPRSFFCSPSAPGAREAGGAAWSRQPSALAHRPLGAAPRCRSRRRRRRVGRSLAWPGRARSGARPGGPRHS